MEAHMSAGRVRVAMVRIAVTGAAGGVGTETLAALDDHEVTPITHRERDGIDSEVLDVRDVAAVEAALSGQDVVVHLAANPSAHADWADVEDVNVSGTHNVYQAAVANNVDRVVFGSSTHVTHMHNMPDSTAVGETAVDPAVVRADDPPRPSSPYGISKVTGEAMGSYYADRFDVEVVNLRIGYLQSEAELLAHQDDSPGRARQARALYLSHRDYRHAVRQAVTESLSENPLTIQLVSRNADRYHSITRAMRTLGYAPRDDSRAVLENTPGKQ